MACVQPVGTEKKKGRKNEADLGSEVTTGAKCSRAMLERSMVLENFCSSRLIPNRVCCAVSNGGLYARSLGAYASVPARVALLL